MFLYLKGLVLFLPKTVCTVRAMVFPIVVYRCEKVKVKVVHSCLTLCDPMDCSLPGTSVHGDSPGPNTGVGSLALLQGNFPNLGIEPRFPTLQAVLLPAEPQGKPLYTIHEILQARILEWVAIPFSRGSSQPRDRTQASRIAGGFFTS